MTLYCPCMSEVKTLSLLYLIDSLNVSSSLEVSCTCHFVNVDKVLFCSQIDIFNFLLVFKYLRSLNETEYEMLCMSFEELA